MTERSFDDRLRHLELRRRLRELYARLLRDPAGPRELIEVSQLELEAARLMRQYPRWQFTWSTPDGE